MEQENLASRHLPPKNSPEQDTAFLIRSRFNTLSKTNRKIANYILEHPLDMSALTISQLSKKIHTSPASITRFCQALGFSGYPELKYCMINNQSPFSNRTHNILPNEHLGSVKQKISSLYLQVISESVSRIDENLLYRATRRIIAADHIYFFSQGGSGIASQFAQISLMQIGISCHCFNDMSMSKLAAAKMTSRDVAIGITFSGMAKVPVDALQIARAQKACTICITGVSNSYIMRYADIPFCYNCKIDDDMRTMNMARICELGIIGLLHGCILSLDYAHVHQNSDSLKRATLLGRYGVYSDLSEE